jgi:hypothetical protein
MQHRKDRLYYPYIPTIVVDDFFESPDMVRSFALSREFFKGDRGYWPGIRTEYLEDLNQELCELVQFKILKHFPQFKKFEKFESTFHLSNANYVRGWVHDDAPDLNVAGFVYLYPDPPEHTGTTFYEDLDRPVMMESFLEAFMNDVGAQPDEPPRTQYAKYREEQLSWFKKSMEIDNVYNRAVIFDPRTWHAADNFFGTTKENTRLTLVYFGKAV